MTAIATTAKAQPAAVVAAALTALDRPAAAFASPVVCARSVRFTAWAPVTAIAFGVGGAGTGPAPGGGGGAVTLPASWLAFALPASGFICPATAQLALARGAAVAFNAATGAATVGGAVLLSVRGKVFAFASAAAFDLWAAINKARIQREAELFAGLDAGARAAMQSKKRADTLRLSARYVDNAATISDAAKRAAVLAESQWLGSKWA